MQVFDDTDDYEYFLALLEKACKRENVEVYAYCLMSNHFQLLLVPKEEKNLSRLMQWVMTSQYALLPQEKQNLSTYLARKIGNSRRLLIQPYIKLDEDWVEKVVFIF